MAARRRTKRPAPIAELPLERRHRQHVHHVEPLAGWRHVEVTDRRYREVFAQQTRWLADKADPIPTPSLIWVVLGILTTHTPASLARNTSAAVGGNARRVM